LVHAGVLVRAHVLGQVVDVDSRLLVTDLVGATDDDSIVDAEIVDEK